MVGLMVLGQPIGQLLFERGEWKPEATGALAWALLMYAPGLVGYSIVKIASPSFYALRDARTPVTVSLITVGINVGLNLWLVRSMGFGGLALGTAIASLVNAGLLILLLSRRIGGIDGTRIARTFVKIGAASIVMGAVAWYVARVMTGAFGTADNLARAIVVASAIAAGVIALAIVAKLLRLEEFEDAMKVILRRVRGGAAGS